MTTFPSNIKIINYHFTPVEVRALYRLILYAGWMPREDDAITAVVNRICKIAQSDELAKTDNQTA